MAQPDLLSTLALLERAPAPVRTSINRVLLATDVPAAVRAARQALEVSRVQVEVAQMDAEDARKAAKEAESLAQLVSRSLAAQGAGQNALWNRTLPRLIARAAEAASVSAADRATLELAETFSLEHDVPFPSDEAWTEFLTNPDADLRFGTPDLLEPAEAVSPPDDSLGELGEPIDAPVSRARHEGLLEETSDPLLLSTSPFAGIHVSIPRALPYHHHAVLVGDGTVVHYVGKLFGKPPPAVRHTSMSRFLNNQETSQVLQRFPHKAEDDPVPTFLPNLVVLRALHIVESGNYNPFGRNCEHFGTWAQCGAMLSGQVDQLWRARQDRLAQQHGNVAAAAMGDYLAAWTITIASAPLEFVPPSQEVSSEPVVLDIGRVRWCRDTQSFRWYLPLWCSSDPSRLWDPPFGPRDRPWTIGPHSERRTWHMQPPAGTRLSHDWHAAVLADPDFNIYILERTGTWRLASIDFHSIVDERASGFQALNRALTRRQDVFEQRAPSEAEPQGSGQAQLGPGEQ